MNFPCTAFAVLITVCSIPASAITVDEIISKNMKARGGLSAIKSLRGQKIDGRISLGDQEGPFRVEIRKPTKLREEIELNGKLIVRTLNGRTGWVFNPLKDMVEPVPLDVDDVRNMTSSADMEGPLVDYKIKGNIIRFAGTAKVEGRDAYKLVVLERNGRVRSDYIDCETFLEVKWEAKLTEEGKEYNMESYFHDYRTVDGLAFSFLINSITVETNFKQRIVIDSVTLNPTSPESIFGKPVLQ